MDYIKIIIILLLVCLVFLKNKKETFAQTENTLQQLIKESIDKKFNYQLDCQEFDTETKEKICHPFGIDRIRRFSKVMKDTLGRGIVVNKNVKIHGELILPKNGEFYIRDSENNELTKLQLNNVLTHGSKILLHVGNSQINKYNDEEEIERKDLPDNLADTLNKKVSLSCSGTYKQETPCSLQEGLCLSLSNYSSICKKDSYAYKAGYNKFGIHTLKYNYEGGNEKTYDKHAIFVIDKIKKIIPNKAENHYMPNYEKEEETKALEFEKTSFADDYGEIDQTHLDSIDGISSSSGNVNATIK